MGFGYVFLGCLLTCNVTYHTYTDIFAVALMLLGLSTLAPYARGFSLSFKAGLPFLAVVAIVYMCEDWPKAFFCIMRFKSLKWIKPVTDEGVKGHRAFLEKRKQKNQKNA